MFTGIITGVGTLLESTQQGQDARLKIAVGSLPFKQVELGESIAVNGVCLTVVDFDETTFSADASSETLRLTTLGAAQAGDALNLERALQVQDRLGGPLVSGHVDGMGKVAAITPHQQEAQVWAFQAPAELMKFIAVKGSICIDGVSLTINTVQNDQFEVMLIPHTIAHTAFSQRSVGDSINLEVDMIARYVERLLQSRQ